MSSSVLGWKIAGSKVPGGRLCVEDILVAPDGGCALEFGTMIKYESSATQIVPSLFFCLLVCCSYL